MHLVTFATIVIAVTVDATYVEKRAHIFHEGNVSQKCMECICQVESGCSPVGCRFDKGAESCGYFQIKEPYYIDCGSPGSDWHHCADDLECASRCVQAYMDRYIDYSGCDYTCESYARIHAGGPRGCADPATITYWHKVQSHGCT
ncbi:hypothetical protein CHS0354_033789 [Potamilus streckersoni]|uniref:lysozyme n=1 Tax=Potamilus streckersoni TaxID=2493646 RepID=A0AAE0SFC0_9BIVA|nr:hypothetical protein CHS0354_033789 [Potamilus streckersoni]